MTKLYLGIDVGGTSIKSGVVDEGARILSRERLPIPPDFDAFQDALAGLIARAQAQFPALCGVGISSCGGIDPASGVVFAKLAPSLNYLIGRQYYEIRRRTNLPVALEKDGNCAALGEIWCGAAQDLQNFLTLVLGSGLGGALCIGGKVFSGAHFLAGDIGYAYPRPAGGSYGQQIAPVEVENRYFARTGERRTIPEMYDRRAQDPAAAACVAEFFDGLANTILTMQYVADPQAFLIGGGITAWPQLLVELQASLARLVAERDGPILPEVRLCVHRNDANLLGAVYNCKETFGL